jgi:4-alpha-glucanotransferase
MRASGILLHIASLPSPYGIGDLGPEAHAFVDFLAAAGQRYWQMLPIGPLPLVKGHISPYNGLSAFAGNELFISPQWLYKEGLINKQDLQQHSGLNNVVDYQGAARFKHGLLKRAFVKGQDLCRTTAYKRFIRNHSVWLRDYALFVCCRRHFRKALWCDWPRPLRDREPAALNDFRKQHRQDIEREYFIQYLFHRQWKTLRDHAASREISLIGDIPIYVAFDSADVWAQAPLFKLTRSKRLQYVGGVPPDLFSKTGQRWGEPVYDWAACKRQRYRWWLQRITHHLDLFDRLRLDHFRGFAAFWQVPVRFRTAVKGRWIKGPGQHFLDHLFQHCDSQRLIAEDLGTITPDVRRLIRHYDLACMHVLQFAFDQDPQHNVHYPHHHTMHSVVYTGTHDNNTTAGWYTQDLDRKGKQELATYTGLRITRQNINETLMRMALASVAETVVIPMQDILDLGPAARMNHPAKKHGNWMWRLTPGQLKPSLAKHLAQLTKTYGRS